MNNNLSSLKVKNSFRKRNKNYAFYLKNRTINGVRRGCYGFIVNNEKGCIVYIDTEESFNPKIKYLIRIARDLHDWHGGKNHFANTREELVDMVEYLFSLDKKVRERELSWHRK